jgi:hypothetical protein
VEVILVLNLQGMLTVHLEDLGVEVVIVLHQLVAAQERLGKVMLVEVVATVTLRILQAVVVAQVR